MSAPSSAALQQGRPSVREKAAELIRYRELAANLVRKELKVRYKSSVFGFLWSLANPAMYAVVFFTVFEIFLPGGVPGYTTYLLAGLLAWNFFSNATAQGTLAVVSNSDLVKKVYFPREVLAFAPTGANFIHLLLQMSVLVIFMLLTGHPFAGAAAVPLVLLALVSLLVFTIGLSLGLSAINVKARDTQHFIELALLAWFWLTPIVYPSNVVAERLGGTDVLGISLLRIYLLNPLARIVLAFQRGVYGEIPDGALIDAPLSWFYLGTAYAFGVGLIVLGLGWWAFSRLDATLAEEL